MRRNRTSPLSPSIKSSWHYPPRWPRALAVLRLITKSNLLGTGISLGFVPPGTSGASPSGRRADQAALGHDDLLTILPLDALHPAKAGKPAVVGDLKEVAVAIFDERMAAPHTVEDPIRQDLCFSRSRRTVRDSARDLSGRSHHFLSFLFEPIDGLSDTSKLHIWLGLRALDPVEAIGQRGELLIGVARRPLRRNVLSADNAAGSALGACAFDAATLE